MKKEADPSYSRYYMHTANALAPEFEEEVVQKPQVTVRPQKKSKPFLAMTLPNVMRLVCAFVLALTLVGQYIYIQGLGYQIIQSKEQLDSVLAQNERLKQEYAAASSLESIEMYAINNLGMIQPGENVAYLPERTSNGALEEVQTAEAAPKSAEGVLAMLEGIADRFGF